MVLSSRVWARLLDRFKRWAGAGHFERFAGCGHGAAGAHWAWAVVILSGIVFGDVSLSVAASTTALVLHNLPPGAWGAGIGAFTVIFAAGQIVGPTVVGWIADGPGGLPRGLIYSAMALWVGAALAWRQRAFGG